MYMMEHYTYAVNVITPEPLLGGETSKRTDLREYRMPVAVVVISASLYSVFL